MSEIVQRDGSAFRRATGARSCRMHDVENRERRDAELQIESVASATEAPSGALPARGHDVENRERRDAELQIESARVETWVARVGGSGAAFAASRSPSCRFPAPGRLLAGRRLAASLRPARFVCACCCTTVLAL